METDAQAVAARALRSDEITLSEQSLSQVGISVIIHYFFFNHFLQGF